MPRDPHFDAPSVFHHVMVRMLARQVLFTDATDRADVMARLAALAEAGALTVYAWGLLPNHVHLLLRDDPQGLPQSPGQK